MKNLDQWEHLLLHHSQVYCSSCFCTLLSFTSAPARPPSLYIWSSDVVGLHGSVQLAWRHLHRCSLLAYHAEVLQWSGVCWEGQPRKGKPGSNNELIHLHRSQGVMRLLHENLPACFSCELRLCLGAVICYSLKSSFHNLNGNRKYLWFFSRKNCFQNLQKVFYHFSYSAWGTKPRGVQRKRRTHNLPTLQPLMTLCISKAPDVHTDFTCHPLIEGTHILHL